MRCPTLTFENNSTKQRVTINQADYNQDRYKYLTNLSSLSTWTRVSESGHGGREGYEKSLENSNIAIGIKDKRKKDRLGQKITFSGLQL